MKVSDGFIDVLLHSSVGGGRANAAWYGGGAESVSTPSLGVDSNVLGHSSSRCVRWDVLG